MSRLFNENHKFSVYGNGTGRVRGSPLGTSGIVPNVVPVHPIDVEIFQSGPKWHRLVDRLTFSTISCQEPP